MALATITDNKDASDLEAFCSHDVVAHMRKDVQVPARKVQHVEDEDFARWAGGAVGAAASGHVVCEVTADDNPNGSTEASGHVDLHAIADGSDGISTAEQTLTEAKKKQQQKQKLKVRA